VKKASKSSKGLWAIRVQLPVERPPELASAVEAALEPLGVALSSFEGAGGKGWGIEVLCEQRPRASGVRSALRTIGAPPAVIAYVPPKNWVAETQRLLAPLRIGRFFIHGAHFDGRPPRGAIPLLIDASIAFGTGRHETTRGCLLALDRLARSGRRIKRPLDLGCGSGILALAVAHLWNGPVLAVDTDLNSVAVARENLRINHAADRVRVVKSHGFGAAAVRRAAPFDLIVANILTAVPAGARLRPQSGTGRYSHPVGADERSGAAGDRGAGTARAQAAAPLAVGRLVGIGVPPGRATKTAAPAKGPPSFSMNAVAASGDLRRLVRIGRPQRTDGKLFRHPVDIAAHHADVVERAIVERIEVLGRRTAAGPAAYRLERVGAFDMADRRHAGDDGRNVGPRNADVTEHAVIESAQLAQGRAPLAPSRQGPAEHGNKILQGEADGRCLSRRDGLGNGSDLAALDADILKHPVFEPLQPVDDGLPPQRA
jgi:ribosomal protein L11 methyltransferase